MTHTGRCHPSMSRLLAPVTRSIRVNRASSPVRLTSALEDRIMRLNRERPHSRRFAALGSLPVQQSQTLTFLVHAIDCNAATVLVGVQGAFATLTGFAALDSACAR